MTLPTNRTTANTVAEHVADHNEAHGILNDLSGAYVPLAAAKDFTALDYYTFDAAGNDATLVLANNELILATMTFGVQRTFSQWSIEVTATSAGSVIRAGLYQYTRGRPAVLYADLGTIDSAAATGAIVKVGNVTPPPGRYGLACVAQGGTPTVRSKAIGYMTDGQTDSGNTNANGWTQAGVTGALPASLSLIQRQASSSPKVLLRCA